MECGCVCRVHILPRIIEPSPLDRIPYLYSSRISVQDHQTFLQKQRVERCGQLHKLKCAKEGSVSEVEKQLMMEEEELIGIRKLNSKCKGISGMVELLECLEREAIMGEDEGREPTDYNRRAQIFDKSSRVFQALKQSTNAH
ncbi:UNVERIFIED_CONTAM: hypothetical protein Sradi_6266800 [Sesamum radiatum]|uniref:Uncharacterized protein n=1 Tax=Sesamum radiatum TaxID=300843 RepID=A0AAW2KC10_SESRA